MNFYKNPKNPHIGIDLALRKHVDRKAIRDIERNSAELERNRIEDLSDLDALGGDFMLRVFKSVPASDKRTWDELLKYELTKRLAHNKEALERYKERARRFRARTKFPKK